MVADGHAANAIPDLLDDASALVAADHREDRFDPHQRLRFRRRIEVTGVQVLVAVAQPGVGPLDQHLAGLRCVDFDLLDRPVLSNAVDHGSLALHLETPFSPAHHDSTSW